MPPKPVVFAWLLCLLMLGGEIVSGGSHNPMAIVFYCFFPAALWMISQEQKRDKQELSAMKARLDRLEEPRPGPTPNHHARQQTRTTAN